MNKTKKQSPAPQGESLHINYCPNSGFGGQVGYAFRKKLDADCAKCKDCRRIKIPVPTPSRRRKA